MSFAVVSFYKYISKRLYDQSFMLCIQILNNMEMYVSTSLSLGCLQFPTNRRTFDCKVFTASKDDRNIYEVLWTCTHINNYINNLDVVSC